jgi:hypothetical protein
MITNGSYLNCQSCLKGGIVLSNFAPKLNVGTTLTKLISLN